VIDPVCEVPSPLLAALSGGVLKPLIMSLRNHFRMPLLAPMITLAGGHATERLPITKADAE
jgi:hypothetical protein